MTWPVTIEIIRLINRERLRAALIFITGSSSSFLCLAGWYYHKFGQEIDVVVVVVVVVGVHLQAARCLVGFGLAMGVKYL
jgi:hypothetical protein